VPEQVNRSVSYHSWAGSEVVELSVVSARQPFEKSKLTPEGQADSLRESFDHASGLGWFCRQLDDANSSALLLM
jgi:hypothetical protein